MSSLALKPKVYFLVLDGKKAGPFTLGELQLSWRNGRLKADTLTWTDGFKEWQRADAFPEVAAPAPAAVAPGAKLFVKPNIPGSSIYGVRSAEPVSGRLQDTEIRSDGPEPFFNVWAALAGGSYMIINGYHKPGMICVAVPFLLDCVVQGLFDRSLPLVVLVAYGIALGFGWKRIKERFETDDQPEESMASNIKVLVVCWLVCILVGFLAESAIPFFKKVSRAAPMPKPPAAASVR